MLLLAILLLIDLFYAWRFSKTSIDPDWAMFNFEGFTGSWYGRDYVDCKSPLVHLYYYAIARVVGKNVVAVRFVDQFIVGLPGVLLYGYTGNFWIGLAFVVLVHSGWLLSFHGNVGQLPAGLFALALVSGNGVLAAALGCLAVLYEPKLVLSYLLFMVISGYWLELGVVALCGAFFVVLLKTRNKEIWAWLLEANVIVPRLMTRARKDTLSIDTIWPPFTAMGYLYLAPWIAAGIFMRPDFWFWLPALAYAALIHVGIVVRQNHLIPLVGWIALAMPLAAPVAALVAIDFITSGFYAGDLWMRFYKGLRNWNEQARLTGLWLKEKPGSVWVNDLHSAVYIYAQKPVPFGMAEQIEIREVSSRRKKMVEQWKNGPPDWVVTGTSPGIVFNGTGYDQTAQCGDMKIYKRIGV